MRTGAHLRSEHFDKACEEISLAQLISVSVSSGVAARIVFAKAVAVSVSGDLFSVTLCHDGPRRLPYRSRRISSDIICSFPLLRAHCGARFLQPRSWHKLDGKRHSCIATFFAVGARRKCRVANKLPRASEYRLTPRKLVVLIGPYRQP